MDDAVALLTTGFAISLVTLEIVMSTLVIYFNNTPTAVASSTIVKRRTNFLCLRIIINKTALTDDNCTGNAANKQMRLWVCTQNVPVRIKKWHGLEARLRRRAG